MSLTSPNPEELSDLFYGEFYSSSNPVCDSPEELSDWRVDQLLGLIDCNADQRGRALEIASYDGQFLYQLRKRGWQVSGCEPNPIGQLAAEKYGFEVKKDFFTPQLYPPSTFDLVVCRFVLEHVPDPIEFLQAVRAALKPGGRIFVEVPDCADRVINRVLGSFIPEHVSYFCRDSLSSLLRKSGFADLDFTFYQGGIIVSARPGENSGDVQLNAANSADLIAKADSFETDIGKKIQSLRSIVTSLSNQGKHIAIYGANTQTIECFNRSGLAEHQISYIVDDDPYKQGTQLVGTSLPVFSFQELLASPVDAVVVSAYLSQEKMAAAVQGKAGPGVGLVKLYPTPNFEAERWGRFL